MASRRFVVISEPSEKWTDGRKAVYADEGKAYLTKFLDEGTLLRAGRFTDSADGGGIVVLRTREAAEAFVANNPFHQKGLLQGTEILEWIEIQAD